jgi:cell division protein FtsA
MSLESAERIKLFLEKVGSKDRDEDVDISSLELPEEIKTVSYKTLVEGIIRPRLNEIFQVVGAELKKSNLAGLTPSGLVLCGGGAMTVGAVDSAKRILSIPVRIGYPMGVTGLIDEIESPAFASSVGLLRFGIRDMEIETGISGWIDKLPMKNTLGKLNDLLKSLLP